MDLIYTDIHFSDLGKLKYTTLDFDTTDTMDFKLTMPLSINSNPASIGFIYSSNSEVGGIIDNYTILTSENSIELTGRNFRGVLNSKIVKPPENQAYKYINGSVYDIITDLLNEFLIDNVFSADKSLNDFNINKTQVARYCSMYALLLQIGKLIDKALLISQSNGKMVISYRTPKDYTQYELNTKADVYLDISKNTNTVNHLICLGSGELQDRLVTELWLSRDKQKILTTPTVLGTQDYTEIYENTSVNTLEDLINAGIEKFNELITQDSIDMSVSNSKSYQIGDIVGGYDKITKLEIKNTISNIILSVEDTETSISYTTT